MLCASLETDRPHVRETTLGTRRIPPGSKRLASIAQTLLGLATLRVSCNWLLLPTLDPARYSVPNDPAVLPWDVPCVPGGLVLHGSSFPLPCAIACNFPFGSRRGHPQQRGQRELTL